MSVQISTPLSETQAFLLAIAEGYRGAGFVSPNPLVGCVILDADQKLLATGYHIRYGEAHAEADALKKLSSEQLKGAHVYVTLEPCAHEGKTPSCAKALAKLPIASVTYGLRDPNPLVSGQGDEILKAAGIRVRCVEEEYKNSGNPELHKIWCELEELCEHFLWNFREKRPFVTAKTATSLDGLMALRSGESKWITNEKSREQAHFLRATHDVLLIGSRTFEVDSPALNVRHPKFSNKTNTIALLDPQARSLGYLARSRIRETHAPEDILVFISDTADISHIHQPDFSKDVAQIIVGHAPDPEMLDLSFVITSLWERGKKSILVEGGAAVLSSFLRDSLVNRLCLFQAPVVMGAGGGLSWTNNLVLPKMSERLEMKMVKVQAFDRDLMITGRLK